MVDMFADHPTEMQQTKVDDGVRAEKKEAIAELLSNLKLTGPRRFDDVVDHVLQRYMLRETNVKDICQELANGGKIENTWGGGRRKPCNDSLIKLTD